MFKKIALCAALAFAQPATAATFFDFDDGVEGQQVGYLMGALFQNAQYKGDGIGGYPDPRNGMQITFDQLQFSVEYEGSPLWAYDGAGNLLLSPHYDGYRTAFSSYGGIKTILVGPADAREFAYMDNLRIVPLSAVPEPTTWAMMILGFGALGAAFRRRRQPRQVTA